MVYETWKTENSEYKNIKGFCKSVSLDEKFDFKEKFASLQQELKEQMQEEQVINQRINDNWAKVIYE